MGLKRRATGRVRFIAAGMWLWAPLVQADQLILGAGLGNIYSQGATAAFLRYQMPAATLAGRDSFYEVSAASWNGSSHNNAIVVARGIRWPAGSKSYLSAELGAGAVSRVTDRLGTHGQFFFHAAFGQRFGRYDLSIGETHYSNGKSIFHWHSQNKGENFLTLQLGREF